MLTRNLNGQSLVGADLRGANLERGDHRHADFTDADLGGANLAHADLRGAVLTRTKVAGASLHRAKIEMVYAGILKGYEGTPDWAPNGSGGGAPAARPDGTPMEWVAAERPVRCGHCGGQAFHERSIMLNTKAATFLNLDWLNPNACVLECAACSHLEWFARRPESR